jgi:predicted esterase
MDRLTERLVTVSRSARVAELGAEVEDPRECWVVLHGYRQLASRFLRRFARLADGSRRIVAPEGLSRFYVDEDGGQHGPEHRVGASWMTRESRDSEIADYVAYLDQVMGGLRADAGPDTRGVVLGFSQGVHTAARWLVASTSPMPHTTVLWGAGLPGDLDAVRAADRLAQTRLILVDGRTDPHRNAEARAAERDRLHDWGLSPEWLEHPGGHRIEPSVFAQL